MKIENTTTVFNGPVNGEYQVVFSATKDETDELRKALAIVHKWEKEASLAVKQNPKADDFTMYGFAVKTDKVIVTIEAGACG